VTAFVMKRAIKRTWRHLFDERLGEGPRQELPLGARFWPLLDEERDATAAIVTHEKDRKICLLDIKEASSTVVPTESKAQLPSHHGERVVAGAEALAPALGGRIVAATLLGKPVFVRELLPQDLKVELDELSANDGRAVARYLGMVVGRGHARQLDREGRARWMSEIGSHRTKNIDAPSWLWRSVVDLVGLHERAYLEHCRRYALDTVVAAK
jgi:uncharacterized protein (DUF2252 family)